MRMKSSFDRKEREEKKIFKSQKFYD
jgi:hypothetical protein